MKQAVLVVDVQPSFAPPDWLVERAQILAKAFPYRRVGRAALAASFRTRLKNGRRVEF